MIYFIIFLKYKLCWLFKFVFIVFIDLGICKWIYYVDIVLIWVSFKFNKKIGFGMFLIDGVKIEVKLEIDRMYFVVKDVLLWFRWFFC